MLLNKLLRNLFFSIIYFNQTMLITFKSKAAADIVMYEKHAKPFLDLLGKDIHRGVITAEECPHVIKLLEQKMADSKSEQVQESNTPEPEDQPASSLPVSFSARFYPLLEMLKVSEKKHCDILWGI